MTKEYVINHYVGFEIVERSFDSGSVRHRSVAIAKDRADAERMLEALKEFNKSQD